MRARKPKTRVVKTADEADIDKLTEVVLGIAQRLSVGPSLAATFMNDDNTLVTELVRLGLAGRRCS